MTAWFLENSISLFWFLILAIWIGKGVAEQKRVRLLLSALVVVVFLGVLGQLILFSSFGIIEENSHASMVYGLLSMVILFSKIVSILIFFHWADPVKEAVARRFKVCSERAISINNSCGSIDE